MNVITAMNSTESLPRLDTIEFEMSFYVSEYTSHVRTYIFWGGGASSINTAKARNMISLQYDSSATPPRHFISSNGNNPALLVNMDNSEILKRGFYSFSSGAERPVPFVNGKKVTGETCYDGFPLTQTHYDEASFCVESLS